MPPFPSIHGHPGPQNVTLGTNCECNQVTMSLYWIGVGSSPVTGIFIRRNLDTDETCSENTMSRLRHFGVISQQNVTRGQGTPKIAGNL